MVPEVFFIGFCSSLQADNLVPPRSPLLPISCIKMNFHTFNVEFSISAEGSHQSPITFDIGENGDINKISSSVLRAKE